MALAARIGGTAVAGRITISAEVVGLDKTLAAVARFGARAPQELAGALYREGEGIMTDSKQEVPVDTGALRSTGHVELPVEQFGETVVTLGYGGPAIPYALRQHEDLTFHHVVGKSKYLEDPFRRRAATMDERLAADLQAKLDRMVA